MDESISTECWRVLQGLFFPYLALVLCVGRYLSSMKHILEFLLRVLRKACRLASELA